MLKITDGVMRHMAVRRLGGPAAAQPSPRPLPADSAARAGAPPGAEQRPGGAEPEPEAVQEAG